MADHNKRILVLDDDEALRSLICRALAGAGYTEVVGAKDGREGLKQLAESKFDLVITDIIMPEADGMEVIFTLLKNNPETRVIAMSGGGRVDADNYLRVARAAGANILKKPFALSELRELVASLL